MGLMPVKNLGSKNPGPSALLKSRVRNPGSSGGAEAAGALHHCGRLR